MSDDAQDFVPPYPKPLAEKPGWWRLWREGQRCPLRVFTGSAYRMKLGESGFLSRKRYLLVEPSLVKKVLEDREGIYPKSVLVRRMLYPVIGNSIFVSNGDVWQRQRRLLEPAFAQTRIQAVFERMNEAVDDMIARISTVRDGEVFDVEPEMTHVTADVIFRTICSVSLDQSGAKETYEAFLEYQARAYGDMLLGLLRMPTFLSPRWWRAKKAARRIRAVMDPMVRHRYDMHARGEHGGYNDILSAMLNATDTQSGEHLHFEYDELVEQIAMLFLAGHETSAAALSWALYLIAAHPEIQERMYRETVDVLGTRAPQFSDMRRLALTRNVFRETLRLYPSVPFFARDATRTEIMRKKVIKPGSILLLCPWLSHRSEIMWQKPHVFDPDRFEREETQESVRDAYFPFSFGPRVCLGAAFALQEATLILAAIVRDFHLETIADDTPEPVARATLRSSGGTRLRITRRAAD